MDSTKRATYNAIFQAYTFYTVDNELNGGWRLKRLSDKRVDALSKNSFTYHFMVRKNFSRANNSSLKLHGPKKEKLRIIKDNQKKSLQSAFEPSAQTNGVEISNEIHTPNAFEMLHVEGPVVAKLL